MLWKYFYYYYWWLLLDCEHNGWCGGGWECFTSFKQDAGLLAVDPNFYSKNLMMLGKTYSRLGNKKLAMLYLTRAREFPINTPDDRDVMLLKSWSIYSLLCVWVHSISVAHAHMYAHTCPHARTHACTHARTHAHTHTHTCTLVMSGMSKWPIVIMLYCELILHHVIVIYWYHTMSLWLTDITHGIVTYWYHTMALWLTITP